MSQTKHVIAWEKWQDPWGTSKKEKDDGWNENSYSDGYEDSKPSKNKNDTKVVITPMGAIPVIIPHSPSKTFNFWVGHTNFSISNKIGKIISNTEGVEAVDIFTRYRMRIAVAKLYKPADVMNHIATEVYTYLDRGKKNDKFS